MCRLHGPEWEEYGVPVSCTSDGGPNLTAKSVEDMMAEYGIHHMISSVANPHANARAELGVKTVKRMLRDNVSRTESWTGPSSHELSSN